MTSTLANLGYPEARELAERHAELVRAMYWAEGTLPVDPAAIASRMGVEVFTAQLGNDVYGLLMGTPGSAQVYVDLDQPLVRMRFTIAHELGHYIEHGERLDEQDLDYVDRRSDRDPFDVHEVHANHFAGALLMPRDQMLRWQSDELDVFAIARRCDVSPSAVSNRLAKMVH